MIYRLMVKGGVVIKKAILNIIIFSYFSFIFIVFISSILKYDLPIKAYIIVSQSMSPNIKSGDLIFLRKINISDLEVGDIISYKFQNVTVTHRIVAVNKENFVTKGDANNIEDLPINNEQVIGKYIFKIPKLGFLYKYLRNPLISLGLNILLIILAIFIYKKEVRTDGEG